MVALGSTQLSGRNQWRTAWWDPWKLSASVPREEHRHTPPSKPSNFEKINDKSLEVHIFVQPQGFFAFLREITVQTFANIRKQANLDANNF